MTSVWGLIGLPFMGFGAGFMQVPMIEVGIPLMAVGLLIFVGDAIRVRGWSN